MKKKILSFLALMFVFVFAFLLVGCDSGNSSTSTHEHTWGTPTYTWSDDYSTCTAERVCTTDATHKEIETVDSIYEVVTPAKCETEGLGRYIVTFENSAFIAQTYDVTINALGHTWGTPTYTWSDDYSSAVLVLTCQNDNAVLKFNMNVTSEITKSATYAETGIKKYKATYTYNNIIYTDTKETIIPKMEFNIEENLEFKLSSDETYYIVSAKNYSMEICIIPEIYKNLPVKTIGKSAFRDCASLSSITIPESVTSIGENAFLFCRLLTSITIPESVTSIGEGAFLNCTSLSSITIPESVTSIGEDAFYNCTSLTSITIPESVTSIGENAFCKCFRLVEIINKSSLDIAVGSRKNGYVAYYAKQVITDEKDSRLSKDENGFVTYNDSTDIWLISYEGSEIYITIPNNITKIQFAFLNCRSLSSITIPESVTSIGKNAFGNCTSLTSITIPESVTSIGNSAFGNCTSLSSITIPESVTSIGNYAFCECTSLSSITIPESVTSIGNYAFRNCTSLTSIAFNGPMEEWNNITKDYFWILYVPATKVICSDGEVTL